MVGNSSEYEIHINKRKDRIYLSKAIEQKILDKDENNGVVEICRPFRIVSKVLDTMESHEFIKDGKELILRITEGQRHEIIAKFYEDTRGVFSLQIQKYSTVTGNPHKTYFTFNNEEIGKLYNFLRNIAILPIAGVQGHKIDDKDLEDIILSREQTLKIINEDPELVAEILKNNISKADLIAIGYRKEQLKIFKELLNNQNYFNRFKLENNIAKDESVWQKFFEKNTWIFGYGLNYIFNSPLQGKKLEQVVSGYNVFTAGKRIDALMQTKGLVSSLCFGEIKTHLTPLLNKEYRAECYSVSEEVSGGIAQVQKTIQKSLKELNAKLDIKDKERNPTGESVFIFHPKSFLIIGSLGQFRNEHGINDDKFGSFELFRRNITNPEIITFDELYERARFIVDTSEIEI